MASRVTRFDTSEVANGQSSPDANSLVDYNLYDLVLDVQLLKERVRCLKRTSSVINRRKSVAVAGDDEDTAIDGTCSNKCMKYFVDLVAVTGMKEISRAKHPMVKAMWAVTLVLSIGITIFYVVKTVTTFIDEPTATKVKIHRESNYSYPALLLCPDTWLDYEKALSLGATRGALQYALGYLINYYFRSPPFRIEDYSQAKLDFETWYERRNYASLVDVFKDIAMDSDLFLYKCPNCEYKNFTKVLMDETICYRIPFYIMTGKGTARSATEILEVKVRDLSDGLLHRKKYWRLYVDPDLSVGVSTVRFIQVFPSFSNTVRFTPARYTSIDTKDDRCNKNGQKNYSTIECALLCANKGKKCQNLGSIRQTSVARNLSEICHYYPQFYWFLYKAIKPDHKLIDQIPEHCFDECPPLCERWMYDASVESHKISSYVPSDIRGNSTPVQMTRIYFLNQAPLQGGYTWFDEVSTYSPDAMIGNIGGTMALWLGASLMSIIQILVFLFTWCFARHLNWRQDISRLENEMASGYISNGDTIL